MPTALKWAHEILECAPLSIRASKQAALMGLGHPLDIAFKLGYTEATATPSSSLTVPHHTVSTAGLVGGGRLPHPGEVSLAHLGVLFLDELPEFGPYVLDTLRQPLEDGSVTIARAGGSVRLPAEVQLVGAMNPCRRGCRSVEGCVCTPAERARYLGRLSASLLASDVDSVASLDWGRGSDLGGVPHTEFSEHLS